jgi:hypothetical protein
MNPTVLLQGIQRNNDQTSDIRCLRLFQLQGTYFTDLCRDVEQLCQQQCPSDVTQSEHVTHWTRPFGAVQQFSLLNASGSYDDFSADHDLSCFDKWCHVGGAYPTLAHFVQSFPHTLNFRINLLGPGAGLAPHEEHVLIRTRCGTVGARLRFHLPIVTNPLAELSLDGHVYHLEAGTIYFVNHGCIHAVTNHGDRPRLHLTWDMLLTRDVFDFMFGTKSLPVTALERLPDDEHHPEPLRIKRIGAYRQLPPSVSAEEAAQLDFCDLQ